MLKKLIIIATLVAGMAACKSNSAKTARDYNNNIIAQETILLPEATATDSKVARFYEAGEYDSIAAAGEKMEGLVQKSIDDINALPVPKAKGVAEFKAAMIRYFAFIKSLFTNYKEYGQADTDEKRLEKTQQIQKTVSEKKDVLNEMQAAQRKFAMDNNFRLEKKTY